MSHDLSHLQSDAVAALDRAHVAARDANGADLRRALEEARDVLQTTLPSGAERLSHALADLDNGALAEAENLLEAVRRDLAQR